MGASNWRRRRRRGRYRSRRHRLRQPCLAGTTCCGRLAAHRRRRHRHYRRHQGRRTVTASPPTLQILLGFALSVSGGHVHNQLTRSRRVVSSPRSRLQENQEPDRHVEINLSPGRQWTGAPVAASASSAAASPPTVPPPCARARPRCTGWRRRSWTLTASPWYSSTTGCSAPMASPPWGTARTSPRRWGSAERRFPLPHSGFCCRKNMSG